MKAAARIVALISRSVLVTLARLRVAFAFVDDFWSMITSRRCEDGSVYGHI
jgi:hypothetical protein